MASEKKSIHLNIYECMENYTHTYTHPTVKNGCVKIVVRVMMRMDVEGGGGGGTAKNPFHSALNEIVNTLAQRDSSTGSMWYF